MRKKFYLLLAILYRYYGKGSGKGSEACCIVASIETFLMLVIVNVMMVFDLIGCFSSYDIFFELSGSETEKDIKLGLILIPPYILGCYLFPGRKVRSIKVPDKVYKRGLTLFFLAVALVLVSFGLIVSKRGHLI